MSSAVRSQNLFELLGEDDNGSGAIPTPKPAPKVAAPAAPKAAAPAPAKKEAAAPRKQQNNRDRAPRQPRGEEPGSSVGEVFDKRRREPTSARGGRGGAKRVPAGAASHGGFDKKSGGHVDSQKKIENGSGHLTGEAELADETAGAADADADAKAAAASGVATPAEGEVAEKKEDAPKRRSHEEEEEEDNTQSYAEYLASKAAAAIEGVTQLSKRVVSEWTGEGEVVKKDAEDAFFAAKEKTQKALKARKEKNTIEIDGKFATEEKPASATRGGRGGFEGRRGGERREGGAPRGGRGGARGAFRGNTRGAAPVARKEKTPAVNLADETAFPSLA